MEYLSNAHTHTLFCDGKASVEEMAAEAARLGFVSLGFTGHSPLPCENDWAMTAEALPAYLAAVESAKEKYRGRLEILTGIELDADTPADFSLKPFELVIGSLHALHTPKGTFQVDYSPELFAKGLEELFDGDVQALCREYYRAAAENALRDGIKVVGHLDLITKYNQKMACIDENSSWYRRFATDAVDRIFDEGRGKELFFEVNTGVMFRAGKKFPYPAPFLLRHLRRRGAKMVINSDAHRTEYLYAGFDFAIALLREAGFSVVYRFRKGDTGVKEEGLPLCEAGRLRPPLPNG